MRIINTLTAIILIFLANLTFAQWEQEHLLVGDGDISCRPNSMIAAADSLVHLTWCVLENPNNSNYEIYYKRSPDYGLSWSSNVRITNHSGSSVYSNIAASGLYVHIVWTDDREGNFEIYYKRSTDGGLNWLPVVRLTNDSGTSSYPRISVTGAFVHITWEDLNYGNTEVFYKCSSDYGVNWGSNIRLTNHGSSSSYPCIASSGLNVHIAWSDLRDGNYEIYYKRSINGGVNWSSVVRQTNDTNPSTYPAIFAAGSHVHIAWCKESSNREIYYKRSPDDGFSWGFVTRITHNSGSSFCPSIVAADSNVHILFTDNRNTGSSNVSYKKSTNTGLSWDSLVWVTNNAISSSPSLTVSDGVKHAAWIDMRSGGPFWEIFYSRELTSDNSGIQQIADLTPLKFNLSQNYPNPFNPVTNIKFSIPNTGLTKLIIYDALGREVEMLVNRELNPGTYSAEWDASKLNSGVYFYKLTSGSFTETKKMILVK